jgi:hypothetical protein
MGFPMKVEPLEATLEVYLFRNRRVWVGPGARPDRYVGSVEWFRTAVLGLRPRWRLATIGDLAPLVPSRPRGRLRRLAGWLFGEEP